VNSEDEDQNKEMSIKYFLLRSQLVKLQIKFLILDCLSRYRQKFKK